MIRICSNCGALLLDDTEKCSFCNASAETRSAAPADAGEPEWRREVSRRLQQYRERRGHLRLDDSQSGLPFEERRAIDVEEAVRERPRPRPLLRQRQNERVEIRIQPELDFSSTADERGHPQTALVPVAGLAQRRWAGLIDVLFLGLTCAGFLGLFRSLGGQVAIDKTTAVIYLVIFYLFYGLYFALFTTLAGATPGMQFLNLSVVRLDGSLPDTRQLVWRSFGYLLAGATLTLGFVWALWDDDRFTWQDRISQTYITAAVPLSDSDFLSVPTTRPLVHK
ncbi:MAG TPA: RDD family protein [Candidatus Acidoferrales bacterium]|nr:RDD family protein [Candidatus Acidoferrales bacterium]